MIDYNSLSNFLKMKSENNISAYILCGGKSQRMQTDKGLLLFENQTFVTCIINAIKPITDTIVLVTNNDEYKKFGYTVISDIYEGKGPVGGIYTALKHSSTFRNLIVSCDVPKITSHLFENYLIPNFKSYDITFLSDGVSDYPLIGIYSKNCVSAFKTAIKKNHLKLLKLIETLDYNRVVVCEPDIPALLNINSKEDLEKL